MNPPLPVKKQLTPQAEYRAALRVDVATVDRWGGSYDDKKTPTLTPLVQKLVEDDAQVSDKYDVLKQAISKLGGDQQSTLATILLGIKETRGYTKERRCVACAKVTHHKSGESFRNSMVAGIKRISIILDEVTDALFVLADQSGLVPQTPHSSGGPPDIYLEQSAVHAPSVEPGGLVGPDPSSERQALVAEIVARLEESRTSDTTEFDRLIDVPEAN
jgi:hypothetical protein